MAGDYDLRGSDLQTYYAQFGRRAMSDAAIWALAKAEMEMPANHIGFKAWITCVAGVESYCPELQRWAVGLAATVARMKPRLRKNARRFVVSYRPEWGRQAAIDGLSIALFGADTVPSIQSRATTLGCDWDAYQRLRDFVAGAVVMQMVEYQSELAWAVKVERMAR